jgi:hypothetical protein
MRVAPALRAGLGRELQLPQTCVRVKIRSDTMAVRLVRSLRLLQIPPGGFMGISGGDQARRKLKPRRAFALGKVSGTNHHLVN